MTKSCIVVDVDGTLAEFNPEIVKPWVLGETKDWDLFFNHMQDALPVVNIVKLVNHLAQNGEAVLICSGRPDSHRQHTLDWLDKHCIPYDDVYLRPAGKDAESDARVKQELLAKIQKDGYSPWLVLDDRNLVVDFWREAGLTCLQVAPGDF
ncbi:HAD family acid phosphatase [Photobacterium sp. MCCC 1A19761]|uniref:phosphatase domain-containing protein n=1 Tax=Photobacterium sp. MCCC 1A19761 TaxID=3115000 RepID=UPI00307D336A